MECRYTYEEQDDPLQAKCKMYPVTDQETGDVLCILADCTPEAAALVAERLNHVTAINQLRDVVEDLIPYAESDAEDRARLGDETAREAFTAIAEARRLVERRSPACGGSPLDPLFQEASELLAEATDEGGGIVEDLLAQADGQPGDCACDKLEAVQAILEDDLTPWAGKARALAARMRRMAAPMTPCTGCGYQDGPNDEDSSTCRDCGDCEDCCWENHGGQPHARGA